MDENPNSDTPRTPDMGHALVDDSGAWKVPTAGELRAAGYLVDEEFADDVVPTRYAADAPVVRVPTSPVETEPEPEAEPGTDLAAKLPPRPRGRPRKAARKP
jgi:hypothetical protein